MLNADSDGYGVFGACAIINGQSLFSVGERGQGLTLASRQLLPEGQQLAIETRDGRRRQIRLPLAGAFQASNALVAAGLCIAAGEDEGEVLDALEHLEGAEGRLQRVGAAAGGGEAYVDYAHTPDGLETVLKALRPHARGRLILVFGAGGDRDRGKRSLMGAIADRLADVAIVTDDNPRSEDPAAIRAAVLDGARSVEDGAEIVEIADRAEAVRTAVLDLGRRRAGSVVVVLGKGHETGQEVAGVVHDHDDRTVARSALDASRAREVLGWAPGVDIATGVARTVDFFRK
mgnify:CR=1 FL=1